MHTCITYKPTSAPPPEMLPLMLEGTRQWLDRYGSRFDTLWWFAHGGGMGIAEFGDETEAFRIAAEHPFSPYCDINVQICVDPRIALDTYGEILAQRMEAMRAGNGAPAAA